MATINADQDYDIIYTLTFPAAEGTCKIRLYRGSSTVYAGTVYYRAGTSGEWTELSVSSTTTTFPVGATTMQVGHAWNKDEDDDYMTASFQGATAITSIAISQKAALSGVVGNYFMRYFTLGCTGLTSLDVPDTSGVTSVGNSFMEAYAFSCESLESLDVPDTSGVTSIGNYFFYLYAKGCKSLTSLDTPDTSGITNGARYFLSSYAEGCVLLEALGVPDTSGITAGTYSFMASYARSCGSLTSLGAPDTSHITTAEDHFLGYYANSCPNLTSLAIPDTSSLTSVGTNFMASYAANCTSLAKLLLPKVGWFASNNVNWGVPSNRLGYLKGNVLKYADLAGWKALTANARTLYLNYIRDADDVIYIPSGGRTQRRKMLAMGML